MGTQGRFHPKLDPLHGPVHAWFASSFPDGPTAAQRLAWPSIARGEHTLLISPTGTGKTLAAFLAILDGLYREHAAGTLAPGLRCVYVSPLRSLGYDISSGNLGEPLEGIRKLLGPRRQPRPRPASERATPRRIGGRSSATTRPTC